MGSGSSKAAFDPSSPSYQVIGMWANAKPIYKKDEALIQHLFDKYSGHYQTIPDGVPIPQGYEFWLRLNGQRYVKTANAFKRFFFNHKDKIISNAASAAKVSAGVALQVADIALPILLDSGASAAKAVISSEAPELAPVAGPILAALEEQLKKGASAGTNPVMGKIYRDSNVPVYTGRGEPNFYDAVSDSVYMGAVERCADGSFTGAYSGAYEFESSFAVGGCGCKGGFIGAAELDTTTVRDYSNSLNSKTKNKIIEDILETATKLGMKITGDSNQAKIKSMLEQVPSGDRFKQNDEVHRKACIGIAEAINRIHGNTIISKDLPPEVICQQVAEIISSLSAGMHTEFLAVYNDVRKVLKNLHVLKNALRDDHEQIVERVKSSDDALLPQQLTTLNDLHKILTDEIDRQIELLSNLLNVTLFPNEKDLAALIKNKKDIHGYIEKIDVKIGSDKFGKVISDLLKGLGITANFALIIERALKTVGITLDEYAKSSSVSKLRDRITQNLMGKNLDESQLHEYLEAAELLYRNFYRNVDIAEKLETSKTGQYEMEYLGGDDKYAKTVTDKRIADRKKLRNLIFNAFYKQLNELFDRFVNSLDQLTMKIGTDIPLSDQLDGFRHVLQRVNDGLIRNKNIYYALIGYYNDAMSKSKKDTLLGDLKMVSSYIDTILEMPLYKSSAHYFTTAQAQIKAMIELIDKFSDEIAAKFGRGEESDPECVYIEETDNVTGAYDFPDAIYGGIDPLDTLEREPVIKYRPQKSIHDAIRQFDYKYRVAQIRYNMTATSKELSHYSEKYEKIIANSIADILESDKKIYEKLRKELDTEKFGKFSEYQVPQAYGFETESKVQEEHSAARRILDAQWETKKKFWATVEAADSYMRVFTDALVKNPNDIREIKSMLDDIEVISDWYNDATGNDLVSVFEHFPSNMINDSMGGINLIMPPESYRGQSGDRSHYYQRIAKEIASDATGSRPGNPYLVTLPTMGEKARNQARKTFTGLAVLKNLLSVFINVGSKFGGEEIRKKVFMTPAQMYNNLVEYLQASAFTQGWGLGQFSGERDFPSEFSSSDNLAIRLNIISGKMIDSSTSGGPANAWPNARTYPADPIVHLGVVANNTTRIIANRDDAQRRAEIANMALKPAVKYTTDVGKTVADAAAKSTLLLGDDIVAALRLAEPRRNKDSLGIPWDDIPGKPPQPQPLQPPAFNNIERAILFKKRWGVWMRSVIEGLRDKESFGFNREDDYFVLVLKSIAAKIFTVTGMYDVLDRPMEFNGLTPIRMITGGSVETPKVEDGAVALYLRLPLLAQFYRGIFGWEGQDDMFKSYSDLRRKDTNVKISMVPDVDGVFAGLIRLIFRKTKYVDSNSYGDEDIKEIIREVNLIYQRMQSKHPQNTVMETIHEFVAEINRRYGIVSKTERDDYEREFGYRYDYRSTDPLHPLDRYTEPPDTEIAILPGELDEEVQRPSAAQRLLGETFETSSDKRRPFTITKQHKDLVYKFRCAIDKYFENPEEEYTFNNAIKSTQLKLKRESRDEERFKLIASLVRGVDIYSKVDGMKYVMFHETVVGGLNLLSAIHSILARFKQRAHLLDIQSIEDQIWDYFRLNPEAKTLGGLINHLERYFDTSGICEQSPKLTELIENLFGKHEAKTRFGGHIDVYDGTLDYALKATDGVSAGGVGDAKCALRWPRVNNGAVGGAAVTFGTVRASSQLKGGYKTINEVAFCADVNNTATAKPAGDAATGGLASILCGYGVDQLRNAYREARKPGGKVTEASKVADTFMRFIFSREYVMKELLETLFGFGHDFQGLVEVKIEDGKLYLSYNGLKTLIEEMFQHISYFLDILRPHIRTDLLAQYTDKLTPGSYYWLQEQLLEKIIIGRPAAIATLPNETEKRNGYANLDELMQKLSYTYGFLTREWSVDGGGIPSDVDGGTGYANIRNVSNDTKRSSYDKVFAEMVFYDASRPHSGLIRSVEADKTNAQFDAIGGVKIVDYLHNPYDALHFTGPSGSKMIDSRYAARFYQLYSWKNELTMNRSAMFVFNQLIAKFIQTFYDPVSAKIYSGLINQFANGAFNRSVADPLFTYPDTVPLFNVNVVGPQDIKIPNTTLLEAPMNDPKAREAVETLKSIVVNYLKYGLIPAHKDDPYARSGLLKATNPDVNGEINVSTVAHGGGPSNMQITVSKLFIYLVGYGLAMTITNLFDILSNPSPNNAPAVQPNDVVGGRFTAEIAEVLASGGAAQNANFGNIRFHYSGDRNKNPTLEQVVYKFMTPNANSKPNINDLVNKIGRAIKWHDQNTANPNLDLTILGPFSDVFGLPNVQPQAQYINTFGHRLKDVINNYLSLPNDTRPEPRGQLDKWGTIAGLASRLFPISDDAIGRTEDELLYRAELFSSILVQIALDYTEVEINAPNTATTDSKSSDFRKRLQEISNKVSTVKSTYGAPTIAQPKPLVKYDDALISNNAYLDSSGVNVPLADANFFVFARKEAIRGILPEDNIKMLGTRGDQPHDDIDDRLDNILNFERRRDPDGEHVLYTSLSVILKNLLISVNAQNQSKVYLVDNVADIPLYMKEKMRANLPAFRNLFKELVARCEFLKKFMSREEMNLTRSYGCAGTNYRGGVDFKLGIVPWHNPWPYTLRPVTTNSTETKNRYTSILDSIVRGSQAFITACEQVLREVGDDPKYFELYQNSIKDYKSQYGVDPLMPLSSTLAVLKNVTNVSASDFLPIHSLGEDAFKFMYGTRSLIGQPATQPLLEHNAGFGQMLEQFNLLLDNKLQVDKSRAEGFHKTFVKLLRYVFELKHVKGILTPYILTPGNMQHPNEIEPKSPNSTLLHIDGMFTRDDIIVTTKKRGNPEVDRTAGLANSIYDEHKPIRLTNRADVSLVLDEENAGRRELAFNNRPYSRPVYSIAKTFTEIIKLTESSFKDDRIKELVEYLTTDAKKRNSLEIQNIIDLNIVPINVHALMREIPLANLYNYAYTFDRLIIELYYGLRNDNARKLISELCGGDGNSKLQRITSAKDMLVALLIDPYMPLWDETYTGDVTGVNYYEKFVKGMLLGVANNGELGRPKFLSDQIYNKAVFGEMYIDSSLYNEMGPPAGQITKVKIDGDRAIPAITMLMVSWVGELNGAAGTRWANILANNHVGDNLYAMCAAIAKYLVDHPHVLFKDLQGLIYNKFLDNGNNKGVQIFKALRGATYQSENGSKTLSALFALLGKCVAWGVLTFISDVNQYGRDVNRINRLINDMALALTFINAIGTNNNANAAFMGLSMNNTHGGQAPTDVDQALFALVESSFQNVTYGTSTFDIEVGITTVANGGRLPNDLEDMFESVPVKIDANRYASLRQLASEIVSDFKFPQNLPNGSIGIVDFASVKGIFVMTFPTNRKSISTAGRQPEVVYLHWLDVENDVDTYEPESGVSLQRGPAGDNDNVLDTKQIKSAEIRADIRDVLAKVGRLRFDTVFIRNLIFIVNLYRSVRMKLQRDLVYSKDIVQRSAPITRVQLTEFFGNQVDQGNQRYTRAAFERSANYRRYNY